MRESLNLELRICKSGVGEPQKLTLAAFIEIFYCTTNVACYNCGPQPNQVIQFTPGRQKSLSVARVGFAISKMRRRFGAGFMIGVDGLNVPAPAQFWRSSKEELRNGIQPKLANKNLHWANRNLQQDNMQKQ
jgi:hypothetical protein